MGRHLLTAKSSSASPAPLVSGDLDRGKSPCPDARGRPLTGSTRGTTQAAWSMSRARRRDIRSRCHCSQSKRSRAQKRAGADDDFARRA